MKHLLTLLLLVPLLATAQTNRYTGYANERILTRNLVLGSDSLGWGNIRIKNDTFQVKLNGVWVIPSAGGSSIDTMSISNRINRKQDTATVYNRTQSDARYEQVSRKVTTLNNSTTSYPSTSSIRDSIYTKRQTDSAIAAGSGSAGYVFSNGIREGLGGVKLGVELAPPYTNGLITEPTYLFGGDLTTEDVTGISIDPTLKIAQLTASNSSRVSNIALSNSLLITNKHEDYTTGIGFDGFSNLTISSQSPTFNGATYDIDYSANYTDRSIPDVGWVKGLDTNVVSSSATLALTKRGMYTFTGTNSTWTLPAVSGNTGKVYYIYNRGSATLTVNTTASANEIDNNGALTNTMVLAPGDNFVIRNNSISYIVQ